MFSNPLCSAGQNSGPTTTGVAGAHVARRPQAVYRAMTALMEMKLQPNAATIGSTWRVQKRPAMSLERLVRFNIRTDVLAAAAAAADGRGA